MPLIQSSVSIAANATNEDILANNVMAIPPVACIVDAALVASATGLLVDLYVGTDLIAASMTPSTANRIPINPDDFTIRFGVRASGRIICRVRNTTGGALTLNFAFILKPGR